MYVCIDDSESGSTSSETSRVVQFMLDIFRFTYKSQMRSRILRAVFRLVTAAQQTPTEVFSPITNVFSLVEHVFRRPLFICIATIIIIMIMIMIICWAPR